MKFPKIFFLLLLLTIAAKAEKLPKAVQNSRNAVVSILTYKKDSLLRSGVGVFTGSKGEILSSYSLFVDADSAVAIDTKGVVRRVNRLLGANELYDCIKVGVTWDKKIEALPLSSASYDEGAELYLVSYGAKKSGTIDRLAVKSVDKVSGHPYYTFLFPMKERFLSAPVVDEKGELVALMQPTELRDTVKSYAVAAAFADAMSITPLNYNSREFSRIGLPCGLPASQKDALTCLHLQKLVYDDKFFALLDDYMAAYPDSYEGYLMLAEKRACHDRDMIAAEEAWATALKYSDKADDVYYNKANVLLTVAGNFAKDSVERKKIEEEALTHYDKALALSNEPLYMLNKANLLYNIKNYDAAFDCFTKLYRTNMASFDIFVYAAKCKELSGDYDTAIAQMDSAVSVLGSSYENTAVIAKANIYYMAGRYREAVATYNIFAQNNANELGDGFYFLREQAEFSARMYQQALDDINKAIELAPNNVEYLVEKGRLCYRVKLIDDAVEALQKAVAIAPQSSDAHYILALCHIFNNNQDEAKSHLLKAKELGHPAAEKKIEELR